MKTRFVNERQKECVDGLGTTEGEELQNESGQFKDEVRIFRDSLRAEAERPDAFWARQRAAIAANVARSVPASRLKPVLLWAPACVAILICLFLFMGENQLPAPDFAAGADQDLLVEVEQALYRDCPEALAPVAILAQEIR